MKIKSILSIIVLATVFFCFLPGGASAASLTNKQVSSIIGLLKSFGTDAMIIANVQTTLNGGIPTSTQPFLTITSPNGGDILTQGQMYNITWNSNNITNISIAIDNYSGDSLVSYDIASSIPASSGSYSWRVGSTLSGTAINPGTQYKILIYGVADSTNADPIKVKDYSNNYFNIISPIQPAITSILPTSGPAGTVVTMTGSGFGTLNTIDFGTVKIPNIPSPDSTTLTFAIPSSLSANSYNFNIINTTDNFTSNLSTFTVTSAISAKFSNNGLASISDAFFKIATGIQTLFGR